MLFSHSWALIYDLIRPLIIQNGIINKGRSNVRQKEGSRYLVTLFPGGHC